MRTLRQCSIYQRLTILIGTVIAALVIQNILTLQRQYAALESQQYEKTQSLVESAHSILRHFYQLQQNGTLSESEARQSALNTLASLRYEDNNYFWVNDYQPAMVMHPFKPNLNGKSLTGVKDPDGKALFVDMVNVVKRQSGGFVPYKWPKPGAQQPVEKISFVKGFEPWQWIVGSGVYLDTIYAEYQSQRNDLLVDFGVIIILSISLSILISKSILHPIRETANTMKRIANGDGDLTLRLDEYGKDEVAKLTKHFNAYTERMRSSILKVAGNSDSVKNLAHEVDQAGRGNLNFIEMQNDNSRQVATAVEQMSMQIQEINNNAEAAERAASDAMKNSTSGKNTLAKTIGTIESLSSNIQQVNEVTSSLAEESNNIGSVLDVIRGISEQTNLLALNAAIEAARAGEQGRGFAVVADEVRTLASRTSESTDEIQSMIERLQQGAQAAVIAVQQSQATSKESVQQAKEADTALTEIERLIEVISQMNSQIARATQEQSHAAQEVNRRITDLSDSTNLSLDATQSLTDTSKALRSASQELGLVVEGFRV
ncbi:chemotaxis protein [Pseudoalteromonas luteoviolacea]|nr:chemotaxis protein [Pseudoalteromonas luteoviolacea]